MLIQSSKQDSDVIIEQYLEGQMADEDFILKYKAAQVLAHSRMVKRELLQYMK